jgi:hypothetical protein
MNKFIDMSLFSENMDRYVSVGEAAQIKGVVQRF